MHHPTDRITHTTAFVTPEETAQWVHPMKDRSDDPSRHKRTLLPRSYISLRIYYLFDCLIVYCFVYLFVFFDFVVIRLVVDVVLWGFFCLFVCLLVGFV